MVKKVINLKLGRFTKSDIIELCYEIGRKSIKQSLKTLRDRNITKKKTV